VSSLIVLKKKELPRRKDDVMREKRVVGLVCVLDDWIVGSASIGGGEADTGEATISLDVSSVKGLCFCREAVGGIFVTCLKNVAIAR